MAQLPEHLLRRAAEARAKAEGRSVDDVLADIQGETASAAPPPTAAVATESSGPVRDLDADAVKFKVPRPLLERAMFARAKKDGTPVPAMAGVLVGAAASAPAATPAAPAAAPAPAGPPPGVRTQRLLTVVKAGAIQGATTEPTDKVNACVNTDMMP